MLPKDMKPPAHNESAVILEGKTRLPNIIQDIILDFGSALTSIQNPPPNSNQLPLMGTIKNFAGLDFVIENSINNLNKILQSVERMQQHNGTVEECIHQISEIQEKFQSLERSSYYTY